MSVHERTVILRDRLLVAYLVTDDAREKTEKTREKEGMKEKRSEQASKKKKKVHFLN